MKKHKFKVGDVVYYIFSNAYHEVKIQKRFYVRDGNAGWPCLHLAETLKDCLGGWGGKYPQKYCHPTPEACAQALVDEFYLINPKAKCDYCSSRSDNLAGTPYISDIGKKMCKKCWGITPTEEVFPK